MRFVQIQRDLLRHTVQLRLCIVEHTARSQQQPRKRCADRKHTQQRSNLRQLQRALHRSSQTKHAITSTRISARMTLGSRRGRNRCQDCIDLAHDRVYRHRHGLLGAGVLDVGHRQ